MTQALFDSEPSGKSKSASIDDPDPASLPSHYPSPYPTEAPTPSPTDDPTPFPSAASAPYPTDVPTVSPTIFPASPPTLPPTPGPSDWKPVISTTVSVSVSIPADTLLPPKPLGAVIANPIILNHKDPEKIPYQAIVCPRAGKTFASRNVDGFDPVRRYTEISGLVISRTQKAPITGNPIMYVVNDGHEDNLTQALGRVGVFDSGTGDRLVTLLVQPNEPSMESYDWEALTIGVCSDWDSSSCLYIADVGDNVARNTEGRRTDRTENHPYRILKIKEPRIQDLPYNLNRNQNTANVQLLDTLEFDYFHSNSPKNYADCEAMFFDHVGWGASGAIGDIYLVTKWNSDNVALTRLYKLPLNTWGADNIYSADPVGSFTKDHDLLNSKWTGADSTSDGTVIALSDYYDTYLFLRCPGASVAEAVSSNACHYFGHPSPGQVETSALSPDGTKHLQIPEGVQPAIGWTELVYANADNVSNIFEALPADIQVCPEVEWIVRVDTLGESKTACRTVMDQSLRPDPWCHYNPNNVQLVAEELTGTIDEAFPIVDVGRMSIGDPKPKTQQPLPSSIAPPRSSSSNPLPPNAKEEIPAEEEEEEEEDQGQGQEDVLVEDDNSSRAISRSLLVPAIFLFLLL